MEILLLLTLTILFFFCSVLFCCGFSHNDLYATGYMFTHSYVLSCLLCCSARCAVLFAVLKTVLELV